MQKPDRTDEPEESQRSRPSSRRSSVSLPRKNSLKKEKDKRSPLNTPTHSAHSTPKRTARPSLDFMVTGKQIIKRADRANSLPGSYRRQSSDTGTISLPRAQRIAERADESEASREPSLEDDLSLDLSQSQVSDFEDGNLKYGKQPLATSTPKPSEASHNSASSEVNHQSPLKPGQKPRSVSLQHIQQRVVRRATTQQSVDSARRNQQSVDQSVKPSRDSTFSSSKDSLYKTSSSASPYRYGTDYSSVSPEYSQSSVEVSPRAEPSPLLSSVHGCSSCTHSWAERTVEGGEWSSFWANYNNYPLPLSRPLSYDQCPTPYRDHLDSSDFGTESERSRMRSPEGIKHISNIIRSEGLRLSPRDAQRVLQCAHLLGSVLSRAVDARARTPPARTNDKHTLTLDLKETSAPVKTCETVTTQTDISLPNTKSAPMIFENILRQLSKSSIDEPDAEKVEQKNDSQGDKGGEASQ